MRKKKIIIEEGICKLTLKKGRYVNSHILPRALTMLSRDGQRAIQAELGNRPLRRLQGWYDNTLAIKEGEDILSDIDNKAITLLRENHLVWSGWPTVVDKLPCDINQITKLDENTSLRIIEGVDFRPLKIFFLSIVWRAAASSREDMRLVSLPPDMLEKLRIATLNQDALADVDFPVKIHQLSSRGFMHNRSPIIEQQTFDLNPPYRPMVHNFCRIYMDGLIAHVALDADKNYVDSLDNLIVGKSNSLAIIANTFESSRTFSNLQELVDSHKN